MSQSTLKRLRVVDQILTKVVRGYNLDQDFSGHHLFPDVEVTAMGGKIITFGKEAFVVVDTTRAPGETVRSVGITYSSEDYALENRLLEGTVPEEFANEMNKVPGIKAQTLAVNIVMAKMRLEGEVKKAKLATTTSHYASGHTEALSGTSMWDNPASDPAKDVKEAKAIIRKAIGRYPNVLHLDIYAYEALKDHPKIIERFKYSGKDSITTAMLASYFDVETVVVAKTVAVATLDAPFGEVWGNNTILAYVPPVALRAKESPSFGYNYLLNNTPKVEKGYFKESDRCWHYPVLMADQPVLTDNNAGFLFSNTATIK